MKEILSQNPNANMDATEHSIIGFTIGWAIIMIGVWIFQAKYDNKRLK